MEPARCLLFGVTPSAIVGREHRSTSREDEDPA